MIIAGEYNKLKVVRKSDLGYMLTDGKQDVLLHFAQANGTHNENDELNVFIYTDKAKRLTATEQEPLCTINKGGFVEVIDILPSSGVFVNINTPKDVLISKDHLPFNENEWPQVGDKLYIHLKEKKQVLVGKPLNRFDIIALHKNVNYAEREIVNGYVCRISEKGIGIITVDEMYVYVPKTQLRGIYRLGQAVSVTITKAIQDEYYGTLNAQKEVLMDTDKEIILKYMTINNGVMKLTAKSSAEEVESILKMSRKAFKRAYGGLYKEQLITFDDEKTYLVKK